MATTPIFRFFAGKGGVGKTTCAAATALGLAESGRRVLAISTDPAHSLADAFGLPPPRGRIAVDTRRGHLFLTELDAAGAMRDWLDAHRPILQRAAEDGSFFDAEDVDQLLRLSLPGADEAISLREVRRLGLADSYDVVVVDMAPTGHALRLLTMPATLRGLARTLDELNEKQRIIASALGGRARATDGERLARELEEESAGLHALLRDDARATLTWVTLPQPLSVLETIDGVGALEAVGIAVPRIIVNQATAQPATRCAPCATRRREELRSIEDLRNAAPDRALRVIARRPAEPRGAAQLRALGRDVLDDAPTEPARRVVRARESAVRSRATHARKAPAWLTTLVPDTARLVLFGGKGGVGKTTCAAATALVAARARPRARILLVSVDPAHSLADAFDAELGDDARHVPGTPASLFVRELDAPAAFRRKRERYHAAVDEFLAVRGESRVHVDFSHDRAVLHGLVELAPPGLDELFAVLALVDTLDAGAGRFDLVIVDTAPTAHALQLLATPALVLEWTQALMRILLKYRRATGLGELAQDLLDTASGVRRLLAMLQDEAATRFAVVTRPAELPRLETDRLFDALRTLGVAARVTIVNGITAGACAPCERQARRERSALEAMSTARPDNLFLAAPLLGVTPRGPRALEEFSTKWTEWSR